MTQLNFATEIEIQLDLKAGWNMVSLPVNPSDNSTSSVFAGTEIVYTWNPDTKSYYIPASIAPNRGYWVAVLSDVDLSVTGIPCYEWTAPITAGWNMVGSVMDPVDFGDPQDEPDGSVEGFNYWYNPATSSYEFSTAIDPTKGYWVAAVQNCTLTLPGP